VKQTPQKKQKQTTQNSATIDDDDDGTQVTTTTIASEFDTKVSEMKIAFAAQLKTMKEENEKQL